MERLFPEDSPLYRLVRPSFDSIRAAMGSHWVSCIWVDDKEDPSRAGFRPNYDDIYGPGSVNVMPFIATWMSSGPGVASEDSNVIALPAAIDRSIVQYMVDHGLLGEHAFVDGIFGDAGLKAAVKDAGRKVYSVDDLGEDFDDHAVISTALSKWLNSKDDLSSVSAYAPPEVVKDMYEATVDDYRFAAEGGGRVYLKTCNTESAGKGVFICNDEAEFNSQLAEIRSAQARFDLNRTLVVQPELLGRNRNFQVFLDPARRDAVQVVAITDQLVEDDGKTYKASVNYPISAESLAHVGPVILDMVDRILARHPEAFGFLMCDFFEDEAHRIRIYDPGIRPTGNTATALATHFVRQLTGRDWYVCNFHLPTREGVTFGEFRERAGAVTDPENLKREGQCVLPWGWNDIMGFGVLIGVAEDESAFEAMRDRITALSF